jgi:PadR family transcriptional regulator PadR
MRRFRASLSVVGGKGTGAVDCRRSGGLSHFSVRTSPGRAPGDILDQAIYDETTYREDTVFSPELKKGSVELMILALLDDRPTHGYELGKLIELRSGGEIRFNVSTLYPVLYRMENDGSITGRWVEKAGERRRCHYSLTRQGRRILERQRRDWTAYVSAVNLVIGASDA